MTDHDTDAILDALSEVRESIADLSARVDTGETSLGQRFDAINHKLAAILMHVERRGEA